MAYDPNNPDKYKKQAKEYSACVNELSSELDVALSELNKVNDILGFTSDGNGDTSICKDALTLNVIVGNEEIKEELKNIQQDVSKYSSLITPKAIELDALEKAEYEAEQARLNALKTDNNSETSDINNNNNNQIQEGTV